MTKYRRKSKSISIKNNDVNFGEMILKGLVWAVLAGVVVFILSFSIGSFIF